MKPHAPVLAVFVLWLTDGLEMPSAAAQSPSGSAQFPAEPGPSAAPKTPPPPAPPTSSPGTAVDGPAPTPVNAPPAGSATPMPPAPSATTPASPIPASAPSSSPAAAATPPAVASAPAPAPAAYKPWAPVTPLPEDEQDDEPNLGSPRYRDAHHDRLLFAPTAETHPKGSFYATSYYVVLLQLGYAVSDNTQISITATPPLGEGVIPGDISLKTVVLREPHVSVAAIGSASGIIGVEEFSGFLGRVGGVATFCAEPKECRFSFSISSNVALAGPASLLFNGAGASYRAGRIVSIIAEVDNLMPLSKQVGQANGLLGGVGVRLSGPAWGVDLGLFRAGKAREKASDFVPFLAATYRYVP